MKKIPTLFTRVYENHRVVDVLPEITPGCEEALLNGVATVKVDGSCCAIINGAFYKRYDAKKGKKPPEGAIPCCDPDPVTGHHPHWVLVDPWGPSDKWFTVAFDNTYIPCNCVYRTFEAVGPHFNGNPHGLDKDILIQHGTTEVPVARNFDAIKQYLEVTPIEGIVFWLNNEPVCKIKRSDFGFEWPVKKG